MTKSYFLSLVVILTYFLFVQSTHATSPITVSATAGTTTGTYTTLKGAFDAINAGTHQGVITIMVNSSTTETSSAVLNYSGLGSSSYSAVNIYPTSTGLSISGNSGPLINLYGADNVMIDGRVNQSGSAKDLVITYSGGGSTIEFNNDATNNTVQYCTVKGSDRIFYFGDALTSGNSGNTIDHCNLTSAADASRLNYVIRSNSGAATGFNTNTVTNNYFYDFMKRDNNSTAIEIDGGNTGWVISGNSFYETNPITFISNSQTKMIQIANLNGNNFTIANNYIGGSGPGCSGSLIKTGSDCRFTGIYVVDDVSVATNIQGNTINNISWSNTSIPGADNTWTGIYCGTGLINVGTTSGNTIGSATGSGSISVTDAAVGRQVYGIQSDGSGDKYIQNNAIGSITTSNSDGTANVDFYGIYKNNQGNATISNNIIGSTDAGTSNSIMTNSTSTTSPQVLCGIWSSTSGTVTISGNTISKLLNATSNPTVSIRGMIRGIYCQSAGAQTVSNNTVVNLSIANANSVLSSDASVIGIENNTSSGVQTINGNVISNLSNTYASFQGTVAGIYFNFNNSSLQTNIYGNFIHDLSVNTGSNSASLYGMYIQAYNHTVYNNIVTLGGNTSSAVYGLYESGSSSYTSKVYYNTVYLGGNVSSGANKSYAFYSATNSDTRDFRNNIFTNARSTTGGSGLHYAAWFNYGSNTNLTLDYNDYYTSGTGGVLGRYNNADKTSLPIVTSLDANSKIVNPLFANAGGTQPMDYLPSSNNLVAVTGTGITTDYAIATRNAAQPLMGALESPNNTNVTLSATSGTTTGSYTNLSSAFTAINNGVHKGDISISINRSFNETTPATLNASGSGSASYNTVNIFPTVTGLTMSGNVNAPLIDLNGAGHVTIDGRVNHTGSAQDLVITNTSSFSTPGNSTIRFINDASNNTVKYCIVKGSSGSSSGGIILFGTGSVTGNTGNTIDHNNITNATDANRPVYAIYSSSTTGSNTNTISNNSIFDFLNRFTPSAGIDLGTNSTGWTISGNSFYETTTYTTGNNTSNIINIHNVNGNNFSITNNYIGGSGPGCSGMWTKSGADSQFSGIYLNVGSTSATSVQGNTISNISWTNSFSPSWYGIYCLNGLVNIGTSSGNTIGAATGSGSITVTNGKAGGTVYGIYSANSVDVYIQNNTIGSITTLNSDYYSNLDFCGICKTGNGNTTISNNIIGSTDAGTSNSIMTNNGSGGTSSQNLYGIYSGGAATVTISGNTISKLLNATNNSTYNPNGYGTIRGIYCNGANAQTISNNTVINLSITNQSYGGGYQSPVIGIENYSSSGAQAISGNTVSNLSITTNFGPVVGIYFECNNSSSPSNIYGNFIHDLSSGGCYGMIIKANNHTVYNNIVTLAGNTPSTVYGLYESGLSGYTGNVYFNTIYIGGTVASGTNNSYAFYSYSSGYTRDFRNNIFTNARSTTGGSNLHYAAYFNYGTSSGLTDDYNDYYASGTGGVLGRYNSANITSLPVVSGQDASSTAIDPGFASAGGSNAINYLPSATALAGISGTGVTTDYAGTARNQNYPAMGAYEYTISPCANPSGAGVISADQSSCGSFDPAVITGTSASGYAGTLEYQWQQSTVSNSTGFQAISSSNAANYDPSVLTATTWYRRLARVNCKYNWIGAAVSNVVTMTVYPVLTVGISGGITPICYGTAPGTFTATGSGGTGSNTYQWYTTSGIISGATSSTYAPGNITASTGYYCAITSGPCGPVNTSTTSITVYGNLTAAISGGASQICYNTPPGTFTATGSGGTLAYTYLWYKNGTSTGVTTQTYAPGNLTATTTVYCTITSGGCGTVNTATSTITVNNSFTSGAIATTGQTICYNGDPGIIGNSAVASGGDGNIAYKWQISTTGAGSGFADIAGATLSSYDPPANLTTTSWYQRLARDGTCNSFTASTGVWQVTVTPATSINSQSTAAQTTCLNTAFSSISVTATGTGTLAYQWYSNATASNSGGSLISGATNASYTPPANIVGAKYYYCTVTGTCGSATSAVSGAFTVNPVPAPAITAIGSTTICSGSSVTLGGAGAGSALQFDGSTNYMSASSPVFTAYTIEAWVKFNNSGINQTMIVASTAGMTGNSHQMRTDGSGHFLHYTWDNNSRMIYSTTTIVAGQWYHVAIVAQNSGTASLYINGVSEGTPQSVGTLWTGFTTLFYGSNINQNGLSNFSGTMDEVRIWNVARTQGQIAASMYSSVPANSTGLIAYYKLNEASGSTAANAVGASYTGTLVNSPTWVLSTAPVDVYSSYLWSPGGATTSSISATTAGSYTVSVTNANGCPATSQATVVTVNQSPTASAGSALTPVCYTGTTAALGGSYGGSATSAVWSDGGAGGSFTNNGGSTPATSTYTAGPGAPSSVTLTLTTSGGSCGTATASKSLTVYNNFTTGTIASTGQTICYGGTPGIIGINTNATGGDGNIIYSWRSSADGYSGAINGATSTTYQPPSGLIATTSYRRYANDGTCNTTPTLSTGTWMVTVRGNFTAGAIQATGETICYNGNPGLIGNATVASGGDGNIAYKWQISTTGAGSGFSDIAGATLSSYDPPANLTTTSWYQRLAKDGTCNTTFTNATGTWQVTVRSNFTSGAIQNTGETICYNGDPSVIVNTTAASGGDGTIAYKWQISTTGAGSGYTDITGATLSSYDPPANLTTTSWYQRLAKDGTCNTTFTNSTGTWQVTVRSNFTSGAIQTAGETICYNGDPAGIGNTTAASGGDGSISYQWQISTTGAGSGFGDIPGATLSSYDPPANLAATSWYQRRAKDGTCNSFTASSGVWQVTVRNNFTSGAIQPTGETICYSGNPGVIGNATAASGGDGNIAYKWQISTTGAGSGFADITGATLSSYIPPANLTTTSWYQRLAKDGTCNTIWTTSTGVWQVTVRNNFTAGAIQTAGETICYNGDPVSISNSTAASGGDGNISYQWQISTVSVGSGFGNIPGATLSSYDPPANLTTTSWYQRLAGDGTCNITFTNSTGTWKVTVRSNFTSGAIQTTGETICYDGNPVVIGNATGASGGDGNIAYQWQISTTGPGSGFADITGATLSSYDPPANLTATSWYQRLAKDGTCNSFNASTGVWQVTVRNNFTSGAIPTTGETICYNGDPGTIGSSTVASGGDGSITYQWQANGTDIPGSNAATYDPPSGLTTTTTYTRFAKDNTCNTSFTPSTGSWVVTVRSNFTPGAISTTGETICFNGDPGLIGSSTVASGGDGNMTYQWQSSTNAGFSSPVTISSNTVTYDPPTGLTATTWYRRQAKDGTCNTGWNTSAGVWQVTVIAELVAGSVTSSQTICYNTAPVLLTGTTATGGTSPYANQWQSSADNLNFQDVGSATSLSYQPGTLTQTTYFRLKQTSSGGCGTRYTNGLTVTVYPNSIAAGVTVNPVCAGSPTTIYASGGYNYAWDHGLGAGSSKVVSPLSATTYTVTATDAHGCSGEAASVYVGVLALPVVQITGSAPGSTSSSSTIAIGGSENLTAGTAGSYAWNTGSTSAMITVSPASTTIYTVTGTSGSCSATATHTVNVSTLSAGANQYICNGNAATLTATASGIPSPTYVWTPGNLNGSTVSVSPSTTTVYTVTVNGILSATVTVTVRPRPVAEAGPDVMIAPSGTGNLSGSIATATVAPYAYNWTTTGGSIVSGGNTATPTVAAAGTYNVLVTDGNGCTSLPDYAVVTVSASGTTVSGNIAYAFNTVNNQMHDVTVTLKQNDVTKYTAVTPSTGNGNYQFLNVVPGDYKVCLSSAKPWGGVTSADIVLIQNHYKPVGAVPLIGIKRLAADVYANSSVAYVDANDRDLVNNRRLNPTGYSFATGDWVFTKAEDISAANGYPSGGAIKYANSAGYSDIVMTVSGGTVTQDFRALCYGDVDASNTGVKDNENSTSGVITSIGLDLTNFPNPFSERTTIQYTVPIKGSVTVEVHTLLGTLVGSLKDPDDYEGLHTLYFDRNGLAPGLYLYTVKLTTGDDVMVQTGKMMINR